MKKNKTIKIVFDLDDWLNANRRAKVHKNKKKYDRKRDKKVKKSDL